MDDLLARLDQGTQVPEFKLRQKAATEIRRLRANKGKSRCFVVKLRNNLWLSDDPHSEPPTTAVRGSAKQFDSEGAANSAITGFLTSEFPSLEIQELEITMEPVSRCVRSIAATGPDPQSTGVSDPV
jgi:hypothetical protein